MMSKEEAKKLAKALVFPHTTGKRLNSEEIAALTEEEGSTEWKEACLGTFEHHGFFTKEEGKGEKCKKTPISIGHGLYYDKDKLNKEEINVLKAHNFSRLQSKRTTKTVLAIRAMRNAANSSLYKWTEEQADKILKTLASELSLLESELRRIEPEKNEKVGYQFVL